MTRSLRPAPPDARGHMTAMLAALRVARDNAARADCPQTLRKIRTALKSAEGARRHLARRLEVRS